MYKVMDAQKQAPNNWQSNKNSSSQSGPRPSGCLFCSEPAHNIRYCPQVEDYVNKGLCKKDARGYTTLPDNSNIGRYLPGKNLMERIDSWHKANPSQIHKVSANFISASPTSEKKQIYTWNNLDSNKVSSNIVEITEEEDEDEYSVLTIREIEELPMLETVLANTQKKVEDTKKKMAAKNKEDTSARSKANNSKDKEIIEPKKNTTADKNTSNHSTPQYKYITPIEDVKVVKDIVTRALDANITLSNRELLAIAPDVRKQIKDQISTKRVAVNALGFPIKEDKQASFFHSDPKVSPLPVRKGGRIVSNHTEKLRAIDVSLNGAFTVEGVLDSGSQIIGLRKDLWIKLGLPVRSDHTMTMESANSSLDETLGLLQDLKLIIGGYEFFLQVQVMENAPYELLLGLPFQTLTESSVKHYANGDANITLSDPNTGAIITIPTKDRKFESRYQEVDF